ncbi:MAG: TRAP transporter small permease subunit [Hyphomicrobiales bacterium]|nr:TRAP transporter small permease subunit [Hyphomicrobiales bacterium]
MTTSAAGRGVTMLRKFANHLAGALMAIMFATFILQIVMRYLAKYQIASGGFVWTQDLTTTCLVWVVFLGGGLALADSDHVKFDMFYNLFGDAGQRVMALITSVMIASVLAWSLPATLQSWLGLLFRWNKPNPTLKVPFTDVAVPMWFIFGVYAVFAVAIIVQYAWRAFRLAAGNQPGSLAATTGVETGTP